MVCCFGKQKEAYEVHISDWSSFVCSSDLFKGAQHFLIQQNARDVAEADKLIPELVTAAGLDRAKFDRSLNDGAAKRQVEHNTRLSMTAGVAGPPMIYVTNQALPGAVPLAEIQRQIGRPSCRVRGCPYR